MQRQTKHEFMKLSSWIVSFREEEEIKRNVVISLFILILCCQFDQQRSLSSCVIMINSYFISEGVNWTTLVRQRL